MIITQPYTPSHCFTPTLKNNKTHKHNFATFKTFAIAADNSNWESNNKNNVVHVQNKKKEQEKEVIFGERKVKCEVEVISWRERRISGEISVNADVDSVWNSLTDYERLADFIPNLVSSRRIPCPHLGRIWLQQRGLQRAQYWHIEARVVLDLQELFYSEKGRELRSYRVDGDFKKFEGKWSVKSQKGKPINNNFEI